MQLSMLFRAVSAILVASVVSAVPTDVSTQDVYVPPVTAPLGGTVWKVGSVQTVTWYASMAGFVLHLLLIFAAHRDTTNPPKIIANSIGTIMLRKANLTTPGTFTHAFRVLRLADSDSVRNDTVILADGFKILNGKQTVTVPWVVDGDDYQIVRT
ncbi:hypothetical protein H0H81_012642 [Sphagnurus paluster]|uniref:Uncharacterized protein n=1 Tax=Sphagnurus paluster TaxID=117069 RepID=A0A9P7FQF9_9AGAR|nr:hypothetical protein H0H81_012642 [Sphagnurus paluster]